jgi:hypothetical protein
MPGTGVFDRAVPRVEAGQQQSHVLSAVEVLDKGIVDAAEDGTHVRLQRCIGPRIRPGFGHHQSSAESAAADIAYGNTEKIRYLLSNFCVAEFLNNEQF